MTKPTVKYLGITFTRLGYLATQALVFSSIAFFAGATYFLPRLGPLLETPQIGAARPYIWGFLGLIALAEFAEAVMIMRKFDAAEQEQDEL